jgi:hypothetical protein
MAKKTKIFLNALFAWAMLSAADASAAEYWSVDITIHGVEYSGTASVEFPRKRAKLSLQSASGDERIFTGLTLRQVQSDTWSVTAHYARCAFIAVVTNGVATAPESLQNLVGDDASCFDSGAFTDFSMRRQ